MGRTLATLPAGPQARRPGQVTRPPPESPSAGVCAGAPQRLFCHPGTFGPAPQTIAASRRMYGT
jgi:hypothetical protein